MPSNAESILAVATIAQLSAELDTKVGNLAWLTENETEKLKHITHERRRLQFVLGHYLARSLAAYRYKNDFAEWRLGRNQQGQYQLHADGFDSLYASISHSGPRIAAAVSIRPVGVDIESFETRERNYLPLAKHLFSQREIENLQRSTGTEQQALFYTYWTIKEAACKALGQGLRAEISRTNTAMPANSRSAQFRTWRTDQSVTTVCADSLMGLDAHGFESDAIHNWWRNEEA